MKKFVLLMAFMVTVICSSYASVGADPITFRDTFTTEVVSVDVVLPLDQIRELRGKLARSLSVENFMDGVMTTYNVVAYLKWWF